LTQWTATVSETVSKSANTKTIRHYCPKLAETSPPRAFTNATGCSLFSRSDERNMKTRFILFRRNGVFYTEDTATGKQTSLRTKDETEAHTLINARNDAMRQPVLNLHLARAYLAGSDPAFVARTWQTVMDQLQARGKESSRERYASVFKSPSFDGLRHKKLLETTADDYFAVFKQGKVAITEFLKRLHNFALNLGWIAIPIVAPYLWPKYEPKSRRGITRDEQETILAREKKAEWKLYLELLWETGAAQSDAASMTAEDVDWQSRTITYFRMKTGSRAQFTISKALEKVLQQLPTTGPLFPKLSKFTANDRASRFRRRCHKAEICGVTLHSYRYAWAERAKVVGMPERFAQAALGHNSKAIHRAYAKKAQIIVPSLEEYETKAAAASLQNAVAA
jgi:site-specific recombinase XerD